MKVFKIDTLTQVSLSKFSSFSIFACVRSTSCKIKVIYVFEINSMVWFVLPVLCQKKQLICKEKYSAVFRRILLGHTLSWGAEPGLKNNLRKHMTYRPVIVCSMAYMTQFFINLYFK